MVEPQIKYALTEDGESVGYWTLGEGKPFLVPPGAAASPSLRAWRTAEGREFLERLSARRMVVRYDTRGFGASQGSAIDLSLDSRMRDLAAVVEAVGDDGVDLCAYLDSGQAVIRYAAHNPERVSRLVLWGCSVRETQYVSDETVAILAELRKADLDLYREAFIAAVLRQQGIGYGAVEYVASLRDAFHPSWDFDLVRSTDVTADLETITAPTLVLHRRGMVRPPMSEIQMIAAKIRNARLALLEGDTLLPYSGDMNSVVAAIDQFLGGGTSQQSSDAGSLPRVAASEGTAVILFTDIADSTALTERLGDARFRDASRSLDSQIRAAIRDAGGVTVEAKTLGDGVLATFGSAAQAIEGARRCLALSAASELGLHIGVHAGDVIREEGNVFGGAVNIAARICSLSEAGEILVSDVVRGMARTSIREGGVVFEDRGEREMKGVGEAVRVYAVVGSS